MALAEASSSLSRREWVAAGLNALAEGGVDSVKVERLARVLRVSKGSFYWHFTDRRDLLAALLDFWQRDLTGQLIDDSAHLPTPRARLEALALGSLDARSGTVDVAQAEGALRAWAAQDEMAGDVCRLVDAQRVAHVAGELALMGVPPERAELFARAIYLALLGLFTVRRYTPELADEEAVKLVVAMVLDAAETPTRPSAP
jgi:AcrR family transcriptional regulator